MPSLPNNNIFNQPYFGLSISQNFVRAIALNADGKINSKQEQPLPPETISNNTVQKQVFGEVVKKVVLEGGFSSNFASITLPDIYSYSRLYNLPKIDFSEVSEAISWQMEKIFPLPKDQIYFDWKLISDTQDQLTVLVVAIHKPLLDDLVEVFEQAGIRPISFEPSAAALSRIIKTTEPNASYALVEVTPLGTSTTMIHNNIALLTVTHKFEQSGDTNSIVQKINQSLEELLHFYQAKYSETPTSLETFITGDSASTELVDWLNSRLNTKVKLLDVAGVPTSFHSAYAAASTSVLPPSNENSINLLPVRLQKIFDAALERKQNLAHIQTLGLLLLLPLILTILTYAYTFIESSRLNSRLSQIEAASEVASSLDLKTSTAINAASASIVRLFPLKSYSLAYINEAIRLLPRGVEVNSWTHSKEKKSITMIGKASSRNAYVLYRESLRGSAYFSEVVSPLDTIQQSIDVDFSITLYLVPEESIIRD